MLSEYFSLDITTDGLVTSIPILLKDYTPNLDKLPNFLMRLGPQVSSKGNDILRRAEIETGKLEIRGRMLCNISS